MNIWKLILKTKDLRNEHAQLEMIGGVQNN